MRQYEMMLILPADADDKVVEGVTDRIGRILTERGGEVLKADRWGRRRFAQEINRQTEGYYLITELAAEPDALTELDRVLALADDVLRFKVVVLPEKRGIGAPGGPPAEIKLQEEGRSRSRGEGRSRPAHAGAGRSRS